MNRQEKLKELADKAKPKPLELNLEEFNKKVDELKGSLVDGIEIKNLDDLLEQLSTLQSFQIEVKSLREAIKAFKLPDGIDINGLDELVKATKAVSLVKPIIQKLDISVINNITEAVGKLIDKIDELKVPKQGQRPEDYVPMRRVMLVGKTLMYDDSFITGSGGGGGGDSTEEISFLTKPFDRLIVTYTDSTRTIISTVVTKLNGTTQETLTNTSTATVDDLQRS